VAAPSRGLAIDHGSARLSSQLVTPILLAEFP
jgi:hypothetical protein